MHINYYQILGVGRKANGADVKKAFRLLAIKYHPDSSADPKAHQDFIKLNEAYQTLSDPLKRRKYDRKLSYQQKTSFEFDANVAQPYYAHNYRKPSPPPQKNKYDDLLKFIPYVRATSIVALVFAFFLMLDYFLAASSPISQIKNIQYMEGPMGEVSIEILGQQETFLLDIEKVDRIQLNDFYRLEITPIFDIITQLEIFHFQAEANKPYVLKDCFPPHYGIFNVFAFFIIGLFISGICGLVIHVSRVGLLFNFGLLNIFLLIITVVITYNS